MKNVFDQEYKNWLREIKEKIKGAQIRAALSANREVILFYWDLGESINRKIKENAWGDKVIEQLSKDLSSEFPDVTGFSRRNLYYIKKFYEYFLGFSRKGEIVHQSGAQTVPPIVPHIAGQLPWSHIKIILDKIKDHSEALFYINQTIENGWGRDVLALQIKSNLFKRSGKAVTNFKNTLPELMSDLAQQTIKDPYRFDFMTMTKPYVERDIGKPMGVSEFEILEKLPDNLRSSLPTIEEIEAGLQKEFVKTNKTK